MEKCKQSLANVFGRLEVITRLTHITPIDLGGKAGQSNEGDTKLDQWHLYSMFACSCPPEDCSDGGIKSVKDLFRLVLPYLKSGNEGQIVSCSTFLSSWCCIQICKSQRGQMSGSWPHIHLFCVVYPPLFFAIYSCIPSESLNVGHRPLQHLL